MQILIADYQLDKSKAWGGEPLFNLGCCLWVGVSEMMLDQLSERLEWSRDSIDFGF